MSDQQTSPEPQPFDVIEHLDKIQALEAKHTIVGVPGQQFGLPHLRIRCPRCNVPAALSGPGKFACTHCGTVSNVTAPAKS